MTDLAVFPQSCQIAPCDVGHFPACPHRPGIPKFRNSEILGARDVGISGSADLDRSCRIRPTLPNIATPCQMMSGISGPPGNSEIPKSRKSENPQFWNSGISESLVSAVLGIPCRACAIFPNLFASCRALEGLPESPGNSQIPKFWGFRNFGMSEFTRSADLERSRRIFPTPTYPRSFRFSREFRNPEIPQFRNSMEVWISGCPVVSSQSFRIMSLLFRS